MGMASIRVRLLTGKSHGVAVTVRRMQADRDFRHLVRAEQVLTPDRERVSAWRDLQWPSQIAGNPDRTNVLADFAETSPRYLLQKSAEDLGMAVHS